MISQLHGVVGFIDDTQIVIDVNGVGYSVICPTHILSQYAIGDEIKIFTKLVVRETEWVLFGFSTRSERKWFDILIDIPGVGGKVGIAILSAIKEENLASCIINEDKTTLCLADGVGEKLAVRIITELKSKVKKISEITPTLKTGNVGGLRNDLLSALLNLGYTRNEVLQVLNGMDIAPDARFDALLKTVLTKMTGYKAN